MIVQDDRTVAQMQTHNWLVVGTDSFMSGWGKANGGSSVAAWACKYADLDKVESWVSGRSDMKRVRVVTAKGYRPRGNVRHFHIYVADQDHPSLA